VENKRPFKVCPVCGKEFELQVRKNHQVCCSIDCKLEYQRRRDAERYQVQKDERKAEREKKKEVEVKKKRSRIPKVKLSIEQIQRQAKAEGLTYGQWVAKHETRDLVFDDFKPPKTGGR
jgi:predicted nucleic acid-binding Zn ribbon protein